MSIAEPGALEAKEIEADLLELWKGIVDSLLKSLHKIAPFSLLLSL